MAWTDLSAYTVGRFTAAMAELLRGNFKAIGDPWTSYSPLWTASTTNPTNYTGTGEYIQAGKLVIFKARVTANAAGFTAGSGTYRVSLPVAIADGIGARFVVGILKSGSTYMGMTYSVSGTTAFIGYNDGTAIMASVTNAIPSVFAANDYIELTGTYEAA